MTDVGYLPLDCPLYAGEVLLTGALSRYFREGKVPNDPVLEASLAGKAPSENQPARMRQVGFSIS